MLKIIGLIALASYVLVRIVGRLARIQLVKRQRRQGNFGSQSLVCLPPDKQELSVEALSAQVNVRHSDDVSEVALSSNRPGNWQIEGGFVKQVKVTSSGLVIDLGFLYLSIGGVAGDVRNTIRWLFGNPEEPVELDDDRLDVLVPASYSGNLSITGGVSELNIERWSQGALTLELDSNSGDCNLDDLSKVTRLSFKNEGSGTITVATLQAGSCTFNLPGSGDITFSGPVSVTESFTIEASDSAAINFDSDVQCGQFEAKLTGNGDLTAKGDFAVSGNCLLASSNNSSFYFQKALCVQTGTVKLTGNGDLEVTGALTGTGIIWLESNDSGGFTFKSSLDAGELKVVLDSSPDLNVEGDVTVMGLLSLGSTSAGCFNFEGNVEAQITEIALTGSGDLTVKGKAYAGRSFTLYANDNAAMSITSIESPAVNLQIDGEFDLDVSDTLVAETLTARQGSGGAIEIAKLQAQRLDIVCGGSGDFTAKAGSCQAGIARTTDSGNIYLTGCFDVTVRTGNDGAVYIND